MPRLTVIAIAATLVFTSGCATLAAPTATAKPADANANAAVAAAAAAGAAAAARSPAAPAAVAPGGAPAPAPIAAAAAAAAGAAAAAASATKPFADVIKDATTQTGLFALYARDDKVWLEIKPDQFDKPFFFSANLAAGLGENFLFGGLMGGYPGFVGHSQVAVWHKMGSHVQLIARNERYFAKAGTPEALAVSAAFSDSLLGAAAIVSQPHPQTHGVLIELNALLLTDLPGANGVLERTYRQSYTFDARNSAITRTRATEDEISAAVTAHYSLARVAQPAAPPSTAPYTPPPSTVPDIRSLFLGFYYNFAKLPDEPMRPRLADARIGYFTTTRYDYSNDNPLTPRQNYVRRWRLEKKDPSVPLSEPKQPIVFWLDRNIPLEYRPTIIAGVEEWNRAFEKIGFRNAVQAKVQPDDADFDTLDARHASIRWMATARPAFGGIGPSQVDPRTGEILDADIGIDPVRIRNRRAVHSDQLTESKAQPSDTLFPQSYLCQREDIAAQEEGFALDLMEARGDMEPGSPEEQKFILDDLKDVVMHEVGHALGLTHNFRASTIYTRAQLDDPEFTRTHGIAGSVMEYNAINIALKGERQGSYSMPMLGPYDYWAIEYGYREIPATEEKLQLARIASRSSEPLLAYAYDEESALGYDPDANISDLSDDPLSFAHRRIDLANELWDRWQVRELPAGDSLSRYRRNMTRGLIAVRDAGLSATRYIGGISMLRDAADSGRTPLNPVAPQRQRDALKLIETSIFSADSFRFHPSFLRKLSTDWLDRNDSFDVGLTSSELDYSLPTQVLLVQRAVLDRVLSDPVAQRILNSESLVDKPAEALKLSEIYGSLHAAIFSELRSGKDIPLLRRDLQREYISHLTRQVLRPVAAMPADARAIARADAKALRAEISGAQSRKGYSPEARAHLAESLQTLDEALKAPVIRGTL
ncbi:MAG: zinc-dependent metalloprotease [Betaproteobacteria bacterium]